MSLLRECVGLKPSSPPREPLGNASVEFQWRQCRAPEAALAVDEDALVVAKIAEFVRFDFVFFDGVPPVEPTQDFYQRLADAVGEVGKDAVLAGLTQFDGLGGLADVPCCALSSEIC
jgi:hypothetical protein